MFVIFKSRPSPVGIVVCGLSAYLSGVGRGQVEVEFSGKSIHMGNELL